MKHFSVVTLLVFVGFVAVAYAGNDYLWGAIGPSDCKLTRDKVQKNFFVGIVQKSKYVFTQKDTLNALTITAIKVTDQMKSHGATAQLINGGPGSKNATLRFTSERGHGIKDVVEVWGCGKPQ